MRRLEESKRILMLLYGTRNGGWLVGCVQKPEVRWPWYPVHLEETPGRATSDRRLWLDFPGHCLEYEHCLHFVLVLFGHLLVLFDHFLVLFGRRVGVDQPVSIYPHPAYVSVRLVIAVQRIVFALKHGLGLHSRGFGGNRVWLLSTWPSRIGMKALSIMHFELYTVL